MNTDSKKQEQSVEQNITDRINIYVNEVTRRLPEKERADVKKELESNIYDMLSPNPTPEQVAAVLEELGNPAKLAGQYRQGPRYLISPDVYDAYIRTLRLVIPIAIGITALVLIIVAVITYASGNSAYVENVVDVLADNFVGGIIGVGIQAFFWVTIGFVIWERIQYKKELAQVFHKSDRIFGAVQREWTVSDLPKDLPDKKFSISLSDTIAELVLTVGFTIAAVILLARGTLLLIGNLPGNMNVPRMFTEEFRTLLIGALIVLAVLTIIECLVKIKYRRWVWAVGITSIITDGLGLIVAIFVLSRDFIFTTEFLSFTEEHMSNFVHATRSSNFYSMLQLPDKAAYVSVQIALLVVCIATIAAIVHAIAKTVRYERSRG